MRLLLSVIDHQTGSATEQEMVAIDEFNDRLIADGHWVLAAGLQSPSSAILIDGRGGEVSIQSGSLHQGQEYLSGFWIIDVPDFEIGRELAIRGSRACNRRVEVRQLL